MFYLRCYWNKYILQLFVMSARRQFSSGQKFSKWIYSSLRSHESASLYSCRNKSVFIWWCHCPAIEEGAWTDGARVYSRTLMLKSNRNP